MIDNAQLMSKWDWEKNQALGLFPDVLTNLKLSGLLPSQLFFPVVNGSAIILSSVMSVLLFKEKLTKRQVVGLLGGIISLVAICLVK